MAKNFTSQTAKRYGGDSTSLNSTGTKPNKIVYSFSAGWREPPARVVLPWTRVLRTGALGYQVRPGPAGQVGQHSVAPGRQEEEDAGGHAAAPRWRRLRPAQLRKKEYLRFQSSPVNYTILPTKHYAYSGHQANSILTHMFTHSTENTYMGIIFLSLLKRTVIGMIFFIPVVRKLKFKTIRFKF